MTLQLDKIAEKNKKVDLELLKKSLEASQKLRGNTGSKGKTYGLHHPFAKRLRSASDR